MQRFLQQMLLVVLLCMPWVTMSQTNGFVCDFEDDADTSAWDFVTDSTRLKWHIGNATSRGTGRSIYVSSDNGVSNSYYGGAKTVFAYRTVHLTPGNYEYAYEWKGNGENNYDFLRVALAPSSMVILPSNENGVGKNVLPSGWIALDGGEQLRKEMDWTQQSGTVDIVTEGDYKFVLCWHCDRSGVYNPPAAVDNISFMIPSCRSPKNLSVSQITNESAYVSWNSTATDFEVECMVQGLNLGDDGNIIETTTEPFVTLTGLLPNTNYDVYVKAFCDSENSNYSSVSFRSACGDMAMPLVEGFENETNEEIPSCWTTQMGIAKVKSNSLWDIVTSYGSKYVLMYGGCEFVSPHISVAGNTLAMDIAISAASYMSGSLAIGFVSDRNNPSNAVYVDTIATSSDSMVVFEVDFSTLNITSDGYVIIKQIDQMTNYDNAAYNIDNIYIRERSNCVRPSDVSVRDVHHHTATLQWVPVTDAASYDVMYGLENNPSALTNITLNGILDDTLTLQDLQPESNYYAWVRTNCGEEVSEWRACSMFTTQMACAQVQNVTVSGLSYSGFSMTWEYNTTEGGIPTQTEVGWKMIDEPLYNIDVVNQNYYIFQGLQAGTRYDVRLRTICGADTATAYLQTIATSLYGIQVGDGNSFGDNVPVDCYYHYNYTQMLYPASDLQGLDSIYGIAFNINTDYNGSNRTWDVYMGHVGRNSLTSTNPVDIDSLTLVADDVIYSITPGWSSIALDAPFAYHSDSNLVIAINDHCSSYNRGVMFYEHAGSSIYINDDYSGYNPNTPPYMYTYAYVPNIVFLQQWVDDGCDAPLAVVGTVSTTSVELLWNTNTTGLVYQVEYQPVGEQEWIIADSNVVNSSMVITNLAAGASYNFRVGIRCNGEMIYSSIVRATTECGVVATPYVEHFEGDALNPCWTYGNSNATDNLPYLSGHSLYLNYVAGGYAILPEISDEISTLHTTFSIKCRTVDARMMVAVGDDNTDISSFVAIDTFQVTVDDVMQPQECNFSEYTGMGHYIAFIGIDKSIYLDDIVVEPIPSCGMPSNLTATAISTDAATITWNNNAGATTKWMIVYGVEIGTERDTVYAMPTENSYALSNLVPSAIYEVMVYNICGTDTVAALNPLIFRTQCGAITLPYSEDFNLETPNEFHPCWFTTMEHVYGTWGQEKAPIIESQYGSTGNLMKFGDNCDIITPRIDANINSIILSFDTKVEHSSYAGDLAIGFTTSTTDLSNAIYVDTIHYNTTEWEHYDVSFASINSNTYGYIVFKNYDNNEYVDWDDPTESMFFDGFIDNVLIAIDNGCAKVTNVSVSGVTSSSADISFDDETATGNYTIGYAMVNDENAISDTIDCTSTTVTLSNLMGGTRYYVWVRKNCVSGISQWAPGPAFTTMCGPIDELPYIEHFDSYTADDIPQSISTPYTYPNHTMPSCWNFLNLAQRSTQFPRVYLCHPNSFIGMSDSAVCMMFVSGVNTSIFAVMPQFTTPVSALELSFKYRHTTISPGNGELSIGVMTDPSDTTTFVAVENYAQQTTMTSASHNFLLDDLDPNTTYYIAFRFMGGDRTNFRMSLDNVEVRAASGCIIPERLTVTGITSESISLSWLGLSSSYNVQYRPNSETAWTNAPASSSTTTTITGLSPQTTYEIRVQSNCGTTLSDWSNIVSATTSCSAAAIPYSENFDGYSLGMGVSTDTYPPLAIPNHTLPSCWTISHQDIPYPLAFLTSAGGYINSGLCLMLMADAHDPICAALPLLDEPVNGLTLSFTYRNQSDNSTNAPLEVGVMTNPGDTATFISLETYPITATKTNASHVFNFDTELDAETIYYIAFRYGGTHYNENQVVLGIDDVLVDYSNTCFAPTQLIVSNVASNTATLQWSGMANSYEVNYRITSESNWTALTTNNTNLDLSNLITNSQYAVRIRSICDDDEYSDWTSEVLFTTSCASYDLPYTEDFTDFVLSDFGRYCWNRYYGILDSVLSGSIGLTPATGGWGFSDLHPMGSDGTNMWIDIWGTNVCDWSVSPQINLAMVSTASFDMSRFDYSNNAVWQDDDKFVVLLTTDEGNTWYTLRTWLGTEFQNIPLCTDSSMHVILDLSQYDSETIRLAFYAESTVTGSDHMILIDNLELVGSEDPHPDCESPLDLIASSIADASVDLSWQGAANAYELQYRQVATANWILQSTQAPHVSLSDLQPGTNYEWRVRSVCDEGIYSLWSGKSNFTTTGDAIVCQPISNLAVSDITSNSAKITWTAGGDELEWEVEYSYANFMLGNGTRQLASNTEYILDNLSESTTYDVYVRALCGDDFYSTWSDKVQFSTSAPTPEGIDGVAGDFTFKLYPNPTINATTISLNGVEGKVEISVVDINGRMLHNEILECGIDCEKRIDVTNLAQGTYFVRVLGNGINSVRKLIVR